MYVYVEFQPKLPEIGLIGVITSPLKWVRGFLHGSPCFPKRVSGFLKRGHLFYLAI